MYLKNKNVDYQDWLNFSNMRVTDLSQLNILCELILSRKISLKTLDMFATKERRINQNYKALKDRSDRRYVEMLIILNTVADLNSFSRLDSQRPR